MANGTQTREPKDLRIRRQLFSDGDALIFQTASGGFIPLPILLRKAMRHLSAPELRALVYLHLRSSKYGICYPTQEEIAYDIGLESTKNLQPVLRQLEKKRFISSKLSMGRKFYLVHDPRVGLKKLLDEGKIGNDELFEINTLCMDLSHPPLNSSDEPEKGSNSGNGNSTKTNTESRLPVQDV